MFGLVFLLLSSLLFGILIPNVNKTTQARKLYLSIMFFGLYLFMALRGKDVAIDTSHRHDMFNIVRNLNFHEMIALFDGKAEYGYLTLVYLISHIFQNPYIAEMFYGAIILGSFAWFLNKYSTDVVLTTFLFIILRFAETMNITRQYIALSILLIAIHFIIERKGIKAALLILCSSMFHTTAIILLPFILLCIPNLKLKTTTLVLSFLGALFLFFSFDKVLDFFLKYFPQYAGYTKYSFYSEGSDISFIWLTIYLLVFACLVIILRKSERATLNRKYDGAALICMDISSRPALVISVFYITYATCALSTSYLWMVSRIQTYFAFSFLIILPFIIEELFKKSKYRILVKLIFVAMFFVWAIFIFKKDGHGLLPYKFFWS